MADIEILAADIERELQEKLQAIKAAETRLNALLLTEREIKERVGNHMKNLQVKKRLEEIQAAARKFAEDLP